MAKEKKRNAKALKRLHELEWFLTNALARLHEMERYTNGTYDDLLPTQEVWVARNLIDAAGKHYKAVCDAVSSRLEYSLNARDIDVCKYDE